MSDSNADDAEEYPARTLQEPKNSTTEHADADDSTMTSDTRDDQIEAWIDGNALAPSRDGVKQVYLIEHPLGFYKIGLARFSDNRVDDIQTGCPFELSVNSWITTTDPHEVESNLHNILSEYHVRGEWFKLPNDVVEWFSSCRLLGSDELGDLEVLVDA